MTATAKAIEIIRVSMIAVSYIKIWHTNISIQSITPAIPSTMDILFRFFCRGVSCLVILLSIREILPISVSSPIFSTIPSPRPYSTSVDMKALSLRSPRGVFSSLFSLQSFSTARLSPVRADSFNLSELVCTSKRSAGTTRPASSTT